MFDTPDVPTIDPSADVDGIQLPFIAPVFYWRQGDVRLNPQNGVLYFGGWETQEKNLFADEFGELPANMEKVSHSWGSAMAVRCLTIVPIRARKRWLERSHTQTLCLVAKKNDNASIAVLGKAVLSVKGYATKYFADALKKWESISSLWRKEWTSSEKHKMGLPAHYFWHTVGTFGNEFDGIEVGKGNKKSMTTQPKVYEPAVQNKAQLKTLYIGKENFQLVYDLYHQAEEWATDEQWQSGKESQNGNGDVVSEQHNYNDPVSPQSENPFDDMPF